MALVHERGWDPGIFRESGWYQWLEPELDQLRAGGGFPSPERWSELHAASAVEASEKPLRFMASPPKKPRKRARRGPVVMGEIYEGRIVERGEVPTRLDDWHDFFNAAAFVAFPRAKAALHARQYHLLAARLTPAARRLPGARTREQDALSLFDEGGIAVALEPALASDLPTDPDAFEQALQQHFASGAARAVPFGHALFEHLVAELPGMLGTLHVVTVPHQTRTRAQIRTAVDVALAEMLRDEAQFVAPSGARGMSLQMLKP